MQKVYYFEAPAANGGTQGKGVKTATG